MSSSNSKNTVQNERNARNRSIAVNRRARHEYIFLEKLEAGLALVGTEVKSLRLGRVNLTEAYASVEKGEVWLRNMNISHWDQGNRFNHDPFRPRKLLLHAREIRRLGDKLKEQGLTLVPTCIYFSNGKVKVEIALARGKKLYDKRQSEAEKSARRDVERVLRDR